MSPTGLPSTLGVVGLGLIGGSLARAVVERGGTVVATTRSPEARAGAGAAGITVVDDVASVVAAADVVVLAVPLPVLDQILAEAGEAAATRPPDQRPTLTDVGSVKVPITQRAAEVLDDPRTFVAGHPMAGTERQGWEAGRGDLFVGRRWALAVDEPVALDRWAQVAGLATTVGSEVVPVDAEDHDRAVALVSHLPYALAATAAALVDEDRHPGLGQVLAAGSFADLTRVAGGHPSLGVEMALANRRALAERLHQLTNRLDDLAALLEDGDGDAVAACFASGREGREAIERLSVARGPGRALELDRHGLLALGRGGERVVDVAPASSNADALTVTVIDPGAPA